MNSTIKIDFQQPINSNTAQLKGLDKILLNIISEGVFIGHIEIQSPVPKGATAEHSDHPYLVSRVGRKN